MSETPKAVPTTQHSNIELYKTANKTASFIADAMLDRKADDGKTHNKILLVIIKRDGQNKALATVRYFLDIAPAKVLFHDLWIGALHNDHNEFKLSHGTERGLRITSLDGGAYRVSLMNKSDGEALNLYFDLSRFQVRCLSRAVLDHLQAWEIASAIYKRNVRHIYPPPSMLNGQIYPAATKTCG
jgi:hypothetical protein